MPRKTLAERFELRVVKGAEGECWGWTGQVHRLGYAKIANGFGRHSYAHRISWALHNGPIPDGLHVLHKCDNRPCTNPDHLFLGTHADNMRDMEAKGRRTPARGERVGGAKLTAEQVLAIRARRAAGERQIALAREYGIDKSQVWNIVTRKVWAHI